MRSAPPTISSHAGFFRGGVALAVALLIVALSAAGGAFVPAVAARHDGVAEKLAALDREIAKAPTDARLWFARAEFSRLEGNWRAALADLDRAARLDPSLERVDLARARVRFEGGDVARAVELVQRYLARRPADREGQELLARASDALGDAAAASNAWDAAVALAPHDPDLRFEQARQRFARGGAHREIAIAQCDAGVAVTGAVALEELALRFEVELAAFDAALRRVARLADRSPRPEIWRERATELLERAGRFDAARAACIELERELARLPAARRRLPATNDLRARITERRERLSAMTAPLPSTQSGR